MLNRQAATTGAALGDAVTRQAGFARDMARAQAGLASATATVHADAMQAITRGEPSPPALRQPVATAFSSGGNAPASAARAWHRVPIPAAPPCKPHGSTPTLCLPHCRHGGIAGLPALPPHADFDALATIFRDCAALPKPANHAAAS